jgi:D-alanine-D-alanine ligase
MTRLSVACAIDEDIAGQIRTAKPTLIRARYDLSVVQALRSNYSEVNIISVVKGSRTLDELVRLRPDVVFNLAFCTLPLEASFAGCLEMLGIPYTGSGPSGLTLASDKVRSRHLLRLAGVRVPRFVELAPGQTTTIDLAPPLIVKPVSLASSAGIYADSVVRTHKDVLRLARRIWKRFGVSAVCDEFIVGREFRIGMVETTKGVPKIAGITEWRFDTALPGWGYKTEAIRINPRVRRAHHVTRGLAELSRRKIAELAAIARTAMTVLDVRGYATVDVRIDESERVTVIEVNPNPGLWSGSAIWSNPSFELNIRRIVNSGLRRTQG